MAAQITSGDNWRKRQCRRFIKFSDTWFVKYILRHIIFLLPPSIVAASATRSGLRKEIVDFLGQDLFGFLNTSALTLLVVAYLYVVLIKGVYAAIRSYSKPARELQVDDLLAVFKALDIVVGDKSKRMSESAREAIKLGSIDPAETFLSITKPDQQIALLARGVTSVFEFIDGSSAKFRSGLMRVINGKPYEWYAFDPISRPPRTSIEELSRPESAISHCIKRKQIIVVDDIQKALKVPIDKKRRYVRGNTQSNDAGSQLCYPIIHSATRKVEYVLCISGNKAGCLLNKHAQLYEWILDHFALRLSMEHSLFILREKANEENTEAA